MIILFMKFPVYVINVILKKILKILLIELIEPKLNIKLILKN